MTGDQKRALTFIAGSQLLALTLWFSASAVAPQLEELWDLSSGQTAGLTLAVQIGFVAGALGLAVTNLADTIASRTLFTSAAALGALVNAGLIVLGPNDFAIAIALRFLTGAALAGVYPAGLKVMAGWFREGRGLALGVLVGALTVGSAGPHLIRGLGFDWQGVVGGASLLAVVAAVLMWTLLEDGPFETPRQQFSLTKVGVVVANRGFRLSTYGYLGHMWELYAMWTWTAAFLAASAEEAGRGDGFVPTATFFIIAAGGLGAWLFGRWADRYGRTLLAGLSLLISGIAGLLTPLVFGLSPVIVVGLFLVWGFAVVADSAQFSTMVTETSDDDTRGTALALQTALGFLLTLVTIRGVPVLAGAWGWQWAFPLLAIGPAAGIAAMVALRRSPAAAALAGGRG
ncbi:MAG: MFS transporter [Acidimicrobiia bacterium]|nr:MFS transporter [Acidimicrobiia bacterium]MBT8216487.1 MFS transporter [Acidimicrobiia bacterium]NNL71252.1 MFS transporter [Acidimicrobiia bacterium]